jgi:hypothetical protein
MSESPNPRRVSLIFRCAGLYGLAALAPMYLLESRIGRDHPPAITHPEYFYGFIGVGIAWQLAFLIISRDPIRYRALIPAAVAEKLLFAGAVFLLSAVNRVSGTTAIFAAVDLALGALFIHGYLITPRAATTPIQALQPGRPRPLGVVGLFAAFVLCFTAAVPVVTFNLLLWKGLPSFAAPFRGEVLYWIFTVTWVPALISGSLLAVLLMVIVRRTTSLHDPYDFGRCFSLGAVAGALSEALATGAYREITQRPFSDFWVAGAMIAGCISGAILTAVLLRIYKPLVVPARKQ